jgi:hypothetical protein
LVGVEDIKKEEEVAPQVTKAAEPQSVSVAEKKAAPVSSKPLFAELKDIVKSHPCSASGIFSTFLQRYNGAWRGFCFISRASYLNSLNPAMRLTDHGALPM